MLNRIIEQYLGAFVHPRPSTWGKFLLWAEWSYNTSIHSGMGLSPYKITFGKKPPNIPDYIAGTSHIDAMDDFLVDREVVFANLKKKLIKAQQTMKHFADNNRCDVNFREGDWVFVKLQPRRKTSVTGTTTSKLSKRFYGPFQIVQKIGPVAYQL